MTKKNNTVYKCDRINKMQKMLGHKTWRIINRIYHSTHIYVTRIANYALFTRKDYINTKSIVKWNKINVCNARCNVFSLAFNFSFDTSKYVIKLKAHYAWVFLLQGGLWGDCAAFQKLFGIEQCDMKIKLWPV